MHKLPAHTIVYGIGAKSAVRFEDLGLYRVDYIKDLVSRKGLEMGEILVKVELNLTVIRPEDYARELGL